MLPKFSHPKLANNYNKKIGYIIRKNKLTEKNIKQILREIAYKLRHNIYIKPTVHIKCYGAQKNQYHLRILLWRNKKWREIRKKCIANQKKVYNYSRHHKLSFEVPKIIAFDTKPLIWDLSEHINGWQLPWKNLTHNRLNKYKGFVNTFIRINADLGKIKIKKVPQQNWNEFIKHYQSLIKQTRQKNVIDDVMATKLQGFMITFFKTRLHQTKLVLTHGDYNPINIMFRRKDNKPFLIDWDHLLYSLPGRSLARLWMFTSNELLWQTYLKQKIRKVLKQKRLWDGFILFAIYEVLKQCDHVFKAASQQAVTWPELKISEPKRSKIIFCYKRALYNLVKNKS